MVESTAHRRSESVRRAATDKRTAAVQVEVALAVAVEVAMAAVASSGTSVTQKRVPFPYWNSKRSTHTNAGRAYLTLCG